MRLYCVSRYRSSLGTFTAGEEVDVTDDVAELLMRDSPGSFSLDRKPPSPTPKAAPAEEATEPEPTIETEHAAGTTTHVRPQRRGEQR